MSALPPFFIAYPEVWLLAMASLVLVVDLYLPEPMRRATVYWLSLATVAGCAVLTVLVEQATRDVTAAFTFQLEGLPTANIRMQPQAGGGGLLDVGCYCVYAIRWAMQAEHEPGGGQWLWKHYPHDGDSRGSSTTGWPRPASSAKTIASS